MYSCIPFSSRFYQLFIIITTCILTMSGTTPTWLVYHKVRMFRNMVNSHCIESQIRSRISSTPKWYRLNRWTGTGVRGVDRADGLSLGHYGVCQPPINLDLDLCISHECWGSNSNPVYNRNMFFPLHADIDKLVCLFYDHLKISVVQSKLKLFSLNDLLDWPTLILEW